MRVTLNTFITTSLIFTNCFTVSTINLLDTSDAPTEISESDKLDRITLNLYCPGCIGCYLSQSNDNKHQLLCNGIFILDTTNTREQLSQSALKDTSSKSSGLLFTEFCDILRSSLTRELMTKFKEVRINDVDNDSVTDKIVPEFSYAAGKTRFTMNTSRIVLTATSSDGTFLKAEAVNSDNISAGHLGWAIPVAILTYPIGALISMSALNSMSLTQINDLIIESVNEASAELVKKIQKASIESGASDWKIKIVKE